MPQRTLRQHTRSHVKGLFRTLSCWNTFFCRSARLQQVRRGKIQPSQSGIVHLLSTIQDHPRRRSDRVCLHSRYGDDPWNLYLLFRNGRRVGLHQQGVNLANAAHQTGLFSSQHCLQQHLSMPLQPLVGRRRARRLCRRKRVGPVPSASPRDAVHGV